MVRSVEEIKAEIIESWLDPVLAQWVVYQLELLQLYSEERFPAPIHTFSIINGDYIFSDNELTAKTKYVLSGGLEGNRGHVDAIHYLHETRALMNENALITILLEPDLYILQAKKREPLLSQEERAELWSRSGLVDLVVSLPVPLKDLSLTEHFLRIHDALGGCVRWFCTDEHPFFLEVLTRGFGETLNLLQLIPENWGIHSSILAASKKMTIDELNGCLELDRTQILARLGRYSDLEV